MGESCMLCKHCTTKLRTKRSRKLYRFCDKFEKFFADGFPSKEMIINNMPCCEK